jgi:protein-tyrosine phosphatase
MEKIKVLFVCMGNICRSPSAEGFFARQLLGSSIAEQVSIDSAGTHAYHVGHEPDHRAQTAAGHRGFDLSRQRARKVNADDFIEFDYVIAMDSSNVEDLEAICPAGYEDRIQLLLDYSDRFSETEVPDPYYGGTNGFKRVLDLIEDAAEGLLKKLG